MYNKLIKSVILGFSLICMGAASELTVKSGGGLSEHQVFMKLSEQFRQADESNPQTIDKNYLGKFVLSEHFNQVIIDKIKESITGKQKDKNAAQALNFINLKLKISCDGGEQAQLEYKKFLLDVYASLCKNEHDLAWKLIMLPDGYGKFLQENGHRFLYPLPFDGEDGVVLQEDYAEITNDEFFQQIADFCEDRFEEDLNEHCLNGDSASVHSLIMDNIEKEKYVGYFLSKSFNDLITDMREKVSQDKDELNSYVLIAINLLLCKAKALPKNELRLRKHTKNCWASKLDLMNPSPEDKSTLEKEDELEKNDVYSQSAEYLKSIVDNCLEEVMEEPKVESKEVLKVESKVDPTIEVDEPYIPIIKIDLRSVRHIRDVRGFWAPILPAINTNVQKPKNYKKHQNSFKKGYQS